MNGEDIRIYSYNMYSKSVHELRERIPGIKIIKHTESKYKHNPRRLLINWGSTSADVDEHAKNGPVINPTRGVAVCADKIKFFDAVNGHASIPEYTTDKATARQWSEDGILVVARATVKGHSGEGIIFSDEDPLFYEKGLLFTKYIPKLAEFRVHIFRGQIIDIQQKKLREKDENGEDVDKNLVNWRVRSHKNGFIFARNDLRVPEDVREQAQRAYNALRESLDFGAFDVLYNRLQDRAYVIECNTAPGITGSTADNYAQVIRDL